MKPKPKRIGLSGQDWNTRDVAVAAIVLKLGPHRIEFNPKEAQAAMEAIAKATGFKVSEKTL